MSAIILGGRYQIVKKLGRGGFGQTYLAQDLQLPGNPACVVKQLKPSTTDASAIETARRLFDTEAEVLYKLGNHNQIPRLFAHFEEKQEFYLVQEFIPGYSLSEELALRQPLSEAEVVELLQEILEILEFIHSEGVIHRDLKPSNLIRRKVDNKVVLIDFGAVKQMSSQTVNSQDNINITTTISIGSPGYVPNEQLAGYPCFSSDIYAVGMIGIRCLTGLNPKQIPKDPKTSEILWRKQLQVSPGFAYVLDKMVRYDFRQRYDCAISALSELKNLNSYSFGMISSSPATKPLSSTYIANRITPSQTPKKPPIKSSKTKQRRPNKLFWIGTISLLALAGSQLYNYYWPIRLNLPNFSASAQTDFNTTPAASSQADVSILPQKEPAAKDGSQTASTQVEEAQALPEQPATDEKPIAADTTIDQSELSPQGQKKQTQVTQLKPVVQTGKDGQSEARVLINLINRNQLSFYRQNKRFAANWQDLGLNVRSHTENYHYRIILADAKQSIVTAIAKKPGLKSYTGAVLKKGAAAINKICETKAPSNAPPKMPAFVKKDFQCPDGSSGVGGIS